MTVRLFRNGSWYAGMCLDEVIIETDGNKTIKDDDTKQRLPQKRYELEQLGYEVIDDCNNPFHKTEQYEFYNEYKDKVVVRFNYLYLWRLEIVKQYNSIENCTTTQEVITRLGALNKLFNDIVILYKNDCENKEEND